MQWALQFVGVPQTVGVVILIQRGLEELLSIRNTRRLLAEGAHEEGADYYPVVAAAHLAWIAAIILLIPAASPIIWPLAVVYLALQPVRYWIIATLGPFWTHHIITLDRAPLVARGPYRWLRHPNYAVTIAETFLLPLAFGAWAIALIFTAVWVAVLRYKISLEDAALVRRRVLPGNPEPTPSIAPGASAEVLRLNRRPRPQRLG
jgi:methyltransferase